jgi:hypothetical protein
LAVAVDFAVLDVFFVLDVVFFVLDVVFFVVVLLDFAVLNDELRATLLPCAKTCTDVEYAVV